MKKILIINPFGIGDVLFTTPVIRAIKAAYPDSGIVYWCNERVADILKNNPYLDKIFALSRGDLKRLCRNSKKRGMFRFLDLLYKIKKERIDLLLDFSLDHRYSLTSKFLGIKRRIGFNYKNRGRFLTERIDIDGYNLKPIVEYYLDLLRPLNIQPKSYSLDITVSETSRIAARVLFASLGINDTDLVIGIVAGAGASWGSDATFKRWPATKFGQLADRIINDFGAKIIILGDVQERVLADTIINSLANNKVIDLTGKTNLEELVAIIDNLHILVTNDGGPLHIAVALGIKSVSIFGPVDERVYGPYPASDRHIVVRNKYIACRPCYKSFRFLGCLNNRKCIEDITVEEVYRAVKRLVDCCE